MLMEKYCCIVSYSIETIDNDVIELLFIQDRRPTSIQLILYNFPLNKLYFKTLFSKNSKQHYCANTLKSIYIRHQYPKH